MHSENRCALCGMEDTVVPYHVAVEKPGRLEADLEFAHLPVSVTVTYVQCLRCGLVWQSPRMGTEETRKYYEDGHYRASLGNTPDEIDKDEMKRSMRIFRQLEGMKASNFLDIGCSRGYLVQMIEKQYGVDAWGVESNFSYITEDIKAAQYLSGVPKIGFDLITMIHVLEHVEYPLATLIELHDYLAPTGRVLIEVPSKRSMGGPFRLAHNYYFETWVLVQMAKEAGYKVISVKQDEHTQILMEKI